jgi:hypothetical protein
MRSAHFTSAARHNLYVSSAAQHIHWGKGCWRFTQNQDARSVYFTPLLDQLNNCMSALRRRTHNGSHVGTFHVCC